MQVHQVQPHWQQYAVMLVVFVLIFAVRERSLMRVRPLKIEQLWIVPAIYAALVAYLFVRSPPSLSGWAVAILALLAGGAIGWQRGKTMQIHLDAATGALQQKGSIWALAIHRRAGRDQAGGAKRGPGAALRRQCVARRSCGAVARPLCGTAAGDVLARQATARNGARLSDPTPWIAAEAGPEQRKHAPATLRNRMAIADVLREVLPRSGTVLEIASGSGEHAAYFAGEFPALDWQPSDPDDAARTSIAAWCAGIANVLPPLDLDAATAVWPVVRADAVVCINMVHISPWTATVGLMAGAKRVLASGAPLILYGPFLRDDMPTAPSNLAFDDSLRARDRDWGIRSVAAVTQAAIGFALDPMIEMPANNLMLVFRRG